MGQVSLQPCAFNRQDCLVDVTLGVGPVNFNVLTVQRDSVFQCILQRNGGREAGEPAVEVYRDVQRHSRHRASEILLDTGLAAEEGCEEGWSL